MIANIGITPLTNKQINQNLPIMTQNTQHPRNLKEYKRQWIAEGKPIIDLTRRIRRDIGVATGSADRWLNFDSETHNREFLEYLSGLTGIEEGNLFRHFD